MPDDAPAAGGRPPRPARLPYGAEVIASTAASSYAASGLLGLPWSGGPDDLEREYGPAVWSMMMNDPAVGSSVDVLRQGIVAEELRVLPAVKDPEGGDATPDGALAAEIAAFVDRAFRRPERPLVDSLHEWTYGLVEDKLAEVPLEEVAEGPDAGLWSIRAFRFKPRSAWRYVVDPYGDAPMVAGRLPAGVSAPAGGIPAAPVPGVPGDAALLGRDRVAIWSWANRDGDPRCRPILRRAANAWGLKVRVWPEALKFWSQFAGPGIVVEGEPDAPELDDPDDGPANPDGSPMTAEDVVIATVQAYRVGGVLMLPRGWKARVLESGRDGAAVAAAVELLNREVATAILHAPRTTQEAKNGSKADSESSGDVTALLVRLGRKSLAGMLRNQVARRLVRINYGPDAAERLTPILSLGSTEHQDRAALITAVAALVKAGYFAPSQLQAVDAELGFSVRERAEIEQARREREAAAEGGGQAKPGDDTNEDPRR